MGTLRNKPRSNFSFEDLPQAIGDVLNRLENIEILLSHKTADVCQKPPITTKDLCKFLNVTEPTITRYRKKGIIPYFTIGSAIRFDLDRVLSALEKGKRHKPP